MDKNITVKISPIGNATIEANNFSGQSCSAATKPIEEALMGGAGKTEVVKPEMYNEGETSTEQHATQW